ncbi:MAG: SpoIID/LytB domain-containing protein [Candidatus Obscuribacterales bacterium]
MQIRVGLKAGDLVSLGHKQVTVSSSSTVVELLSDGVSGQKIPGTGPVTISVTAGGALQVIGITGGAKQAARVRVSDAHGGRLHLTSTAKTGSKKGPVTYTGALEAFNNGSSGELRLVLVCDLEDYVKGVLQSEIPASYKLAAMEAQAVLARTYGLNPRLSHEQDQCNVCDSFLCCQAFVGVDARLTAGQLQAITQTRGQILTYEGKPALALFSANAGGHTESYENCFSDPVTHKFPDDPIPYLHGVAEGKLPAGFPSESALRALHGAANVATDDSWSPSFKWTANFPADALEAHMHHVIAQVSKESQFAPFVVAPPSGSFGHIERFEVSRRGIAGVAMELKIHTSKGVWIVRKELTIRSVFANPELGVKRLRSARLFFDFARDRLGLLSKVTVSGLGTGHGVGLQQNGAQGLARQGKTYREILAHYYAGAIVRPVQ